MEQGFHPVERELESQAHRETLEEGVRAEMLAAIERTVAPEEKDALFAIAEPGLSYEDRESRRVAFNMLEAGTPDEDEPLEGRVHSNVEINMGGTVLKVSRNIHGKFSVSSFG